MRFSIWRDAGAALLPFAALLLCAGAAHACPSCAPGDGENGAGFLAATFLMMGLPVAVIAGGSWWLVSRYRHDQEPGVEPKGVREFPSAPENTSEDPRR